MQRPPPPRAAPAAAPVRAQATVNKRPLEAPEGQIKNQPPAKKAFIHPSRVTNIPQHTIMATRSQKRPLEMSEAEVTIQPPKKIFVHPSRANLVPQAPQNAASFFD